MNRMSTAEIARKVNELGPWFHNLDLGGVMTAPSHFLGDYPRQKFARFSHALPADLSGATVLDIGCNAGFYAFEMKRRGAARVVGIDASAEYLEQARFAASVTGLDVELRLLDVYDVARLGARFDIVLFLGVLYHLRHPLLALDLLREHVVKGTLVFQSMLRGALDASPFDVDDDYPFDETAVFDDPRWPKLHFVEKCYAGDPTNWWIPNLAAAEAMLRSAGFRIESRPEAEVFICAPDGADGVDHAGQP